MRVFPTTVLLFSAFAWLFLCSLNRADGFSFSFSNFNEDDVSRLKLSDDSYIIYNAIQITRDVRGASMVNLSGRAFYYKPFTIRRRDGIRAAFNTTFVLHIESETNPGGEGLAFVMAADSSLPENSYGKWLGIVNETTNGTRQASIVAVEFDTLKSFEEDLDDDHVGVNVNGIHSIKQAPLISYGVELSKGKDVRATVRYDGENMSIFVSMANETGGKTEIPIFSLPLDLSVLPNEVFLGFSASTSNYTQLNCVKSWQFNGSDFGDKKMNPRIWIYASVSAVIVVLLVGIGLFFLWKKRSTKLSAKELYQGIEDQIKCSSTAPKKFLLAELKTATGKFSHINKLGKGGFGTVYRGILMNKEVAVKRISENSRQGKQEFIAEITIIGSLHHRNLVKLVGWCYEKRDLLLVYEFMPNGSLDRFIYGEDEVAKEEPTLKWEKRYAIVCGVAEALDYLHNKCENRVLHRDIKASNIMLDSDFSAKLGDFGLARTIQEREQTHHSTGGIAGTPAYMAPESFLKGRATVETDIYAFGVFLLEVVCGRKPGVPNRMDDYDKNIVHWLWGFHKKERILEAVDKRLKGEFEEEQVERTMILGLACCHPNPQRRPSMNKVLQILAGEAAPPKVPTERPAFVWPPIPHSLREDSEESSSGGNQVTQITELSGR